MATLLCAAACAAAKPPPGAALSVVAAQNDIASLNGETVTVRGWLSEPCGGLTCLLLATPVKPPKMIAYDAPYLSIAGGTRVESALTANAGKEVMLTGVVSSKCRSNGVLCTDRAPDITPVSVKPVPVTKDK